MENATDYKTEFNEAVTDLIAKGIADRAERMIAVQALTDAYIDSTGEQPDPTELERLTDYILREELLDPDPYKIAHTEYPFMSERQLDLRRDREMSATAAETVGVDGQNYRRPKRRQRTDYENWRVDVGAKIRNEQRAQQYAKDTAPGPLITYNLRENGGELAPEFVTCIGIGQRWRDEMSAVNETEIVEVTEQIAA